MTNSTTIDHVLNNGQIANWWREN